MEQSLKVKIQPLTAELFRPYGEVLKPKQLIYPETEEGRVAMEMLAIKYRPNAKKMDQLAIHFSYNQTFIPVQGSLV
jgi:ureidoglycolate hydrolase